MDTSTLNDNTTLTDDLVMGHKVIGYALKLFAWGTALAVAWSCSTLLMGIIMFIIVGILMAIIMELIHLVIMFKVPAAPIETVGRTVGRFARVFTRKTPVAA